MPPQEAADAVLFMVTRPRHVTIRDLVILPDPPDPEDVRHVSDRN
jgi:ribitol 2-dehydrogenase